MSSSKLTSIPVAISEIDAIRQDKPPAESIGRLFVTERQKDDEVIQFTNASMITLSQIPSVGHSAEDVCLSLMRFLFPDHVDEWRFRATVPASLYKRLEPMVKSVQEAVATAVLTKPISEVLINPEASSAHIRSASFKIAGAPRGSWAGLSRPLAAVHLQSSDGPVLVAMKQARVLFVDKIEYIASNRQGPCEHPPFKASTSLNAYAFTRMGCTVLLLGMARRPYIDNEYDDFSLLTRGLSIVGHEFSHLVERHGYRTSKMPFLLPRYREITYNEAAADLTSTIAIIRASAIPRNEFIASYCELWCARTASTLFYTPSKSNVHPFANERCDALMGTLEDIVISGNLLD